MPVSVKGDVDARKERHALILFLHEGEIFQLVQRVGGIGDELAEKYLVMRIQRMDNQREKLIDLSLELVFGHAGKTTLKSIVGKERGGRRDKSYCGSWFRSNGVAW